MKYYLRVLTDKKTAANERFGVMAAVARRKCSGNLQLPAPQEVQWKPPLRQAATTLSASGGRRQPKRLNVNANNRSERAEPENISLKSVEKSPKNCT